LGELESALVEISQNYQIVPFGEPETREWGKYVNTAGRPLPVLDNLIAATALANDLELVMEDSHDFPGVPSINPAKP
jgi:toxin FitB